jgi:hypothetical protein
LTTTCDQGRIAPSISTAPSRTRVPEMSSRIGGKLGSVPGAPYLTRSVPATPYLTRGSRLPGFGGGALQLGAGLLPSQNLAQAVFERRPQLLLFQRSAGALSTSGLSRRAATLSGWRRPSRGSVGGAAVSHDCHSSNHVTKPSLKPSSTLQNHVKHDICGIG